MRTNRIPVYPTRIVTNDVSAWAQGQCFSVYTEDGLELVVHLMLGEPKRKRGRVASKVVNLDAVELLQADVRKRQFGHTEFAQLLPNKDFKLTDTFIAHDEKVAAAAGRVEELDFA